MDHVDEHADVLDGRALVDAVAEVEDVSRAPAGAGQDRLHTLADRRRRGEQRGRIQVALHAHVVPRWNGDTNYMAVIGETRVIPDGLNALYRELRSRVSAADAGQG